MMVTLMKDTTGSWTDASQVLVANADGFKAAGHVGVFANGFFDVNGVRVDPATATGFVATPIPGAVWLFGSGVLGLLGIGYTRRRRAAA
jgi:hypothetical protein